MFTMQMAVENFFDVKAFDDPVKNGVKKILNGMGAYTRTVARNSIKTGGPGEHSPAGRPPTGHDGARRYKDFIFYFFGRESEEMICGAVLLPRADRTLVPGVLEEGGQVNDGNGGTFFQEPRPHMLPAFEKAKEKFLPKLIENSIVQ